MTDVPTATRTLAILAVEASRVAQREPRMTVDEPLGLAFIVTVVLAVLLGVATAGLALYRYRARSDPGLRSFVVGLVLIAVAPLPLRIFVEGTVPPVLRDVFLPIFETLGLLAILWGMYGDPRPTDGRLIHRPTTRDLAVVGLSLAFATATVGVGVLLGSGAAILAAGAVVALATFVAGQAARAAYRYRSLAMGSLSLGVLCLVAFPTPVSVLLRAAGPVPDVLVVGLISGAVLVGEAAMFVTLVYR
ncbi:hypothetical protein [Halorussus amylolyticus]|uniref:hypothetical protein n=1 Tax=Halorussus amylolyticus TaxID=1126242 RepID=UPI00104AE7D5|nr:hypothetical protein [Halorussus amylolyticus]